MRAGYLGPEGTWSHEALLASTDAQSVEPVPFRTIRDTVLAVRDGAVDRAIVPIDNALEGSVGPTVDALVFEASSVAAVAEVVQPISHALIARTDLALEDIRTVASHPQASAQSARFLATELAHADVLPAASTAEAVRTLSGPAAALGSRAAAERYGCKVLRDGVEDVPGNTTRFLWLEPGPARPGPGSRQRTIALWWGAGATEPGWLVGCLSCFSSREINLTRIESRPHREIRGEFLFLVDLDGAVTEPRVAAALDELRSRADEVRVLGSYPIAPT